MDKKLLIVAGILGFLGVALGAFGAHGLKNSLSGEMIEIYKTGVEYQLIHSVVLLALALSTGNSFKISKWFFLVGIILFSFSLYFYAVTGKLFFAMITPFGGVSFLIGWLSVVWYAFKMKKQ
jgi:uncharacterized membrane protein YgdD (TMEM256/DUF423 family)